MSINQNYTTTYGTLTSNLNYYGVNSSLKLASPYGIGLYPTAPSYAMTSCMNWSLASTATAITSLGFTDIPITANRSYIFTFYHKPSTASMPYYFKPPNNVVSVTSVGGLVSTNVPVYGLQNTTLPSSYTYIIQTFTIMNLSGSTNPSYIAFASISGY